MPRPCHCRRITMRPHSRHFVPTDMQDSAPAQCMLPLDCLEAIRLADLKGMGMDAAALQMGVSRHTFGRLLRKGRRIVAEAICLGKSLAIAASAESVIQLQTNGEMNMSEAILVAVPSEAPGGLDAKPSAHFGHCAAYTIATVQDGKIDGVRVAPNQGHEHGGCVQPVQELAKDGVKALLAGGMGMRPLSAMQEAGIAVYYSTGFCTVKEALEAFAAGKLQAFGSDQLCKGCGGHH